MPLKILLVAEEAAGMRTLSALAKTDHRIVAVMAAPDSGAAKVPSVWRLAKSMALPTWPAARVKQDDFAAKLAAEEIDVLLNVHSLCLIRESILATARFGAFNLHPGPLPNYAGLNAPSWAIYNGEKTHTVTLHKMAAGIDTGAIVDTESFPLEETDTALTVSSKCVKLGIPLILAMLRSLEAAPASLRMTPQDLSERHYYGREVPQRRRVDWTRPAERIVNFVRACDYHPFASPWGHPIARLDGQSLRARTLTGTAPSLGIPVTAS